MALEINIAPKPKDAHFSMMRSVQSSRPDVTLNVATGSLPTAVQSIPSYFSTSCKSDFSHMHNLLVQRIEKRRSSPISDSLRSRGQYSVYCAIIEEYFSFYERNGRLNDIIQAINNIEIHNYLTRELNIETDIVTWASKKMNTSRVVTALVLGDLLGISPEKCFNRFPVNKANAQIDTELLPSLRLPPKALSTDHSAWVLKWMYPIRGIGGGVLQTVCIYANGKETVTVYADADMVFGATCLPAFLPSIDIIDGNPYYTVHLCLCPDIAQAYLQRARVEHLAKHADIVVTGCFGGIRELEALDLSCLSHHAVVLICSPDRDEWAGIEALGKRCMQHGAESVEFYPWPIVVS